MTKFEDELFVDLYSRLIYEVGNAHSVTTLVIDFLKKQKMLIADGDILEVDEFVIGDSQATVWFPLLDEDLLEDDLFWDEEEYWANEPYEECD